MDPHYATRQQRLHQFQQQQEMLQEQDEYAAYAGIQHHPLTQSPALYSPQPHYTQQLSPADYLPYPTSNNFDNALVDVGNGYDDYDHAHEMIMQEREQDPWKELAEWYWNLYNDHQGLLDPKRAGERHDSYDSGNSPTNHVFPAVERAEERKPELPEKPFRDQLVHLYFVHVHPLCPVFDEHEFCKAYDATEDGLFALQVVTLLEFQSILFAGSLHLDNTQLGSTNYTGTHNCHKTLFKAAKNTYHACQHESRIASTRAAILLSLWAPYNSDHSNSYWVDQAIANAQAANLSDISHQPSIIPVGRRKLIWMSLLRRDRYLAFASRRSTRLPSSQRNTPMYVTREDYGLEAVKPRFMSPVAKLASIENFSQQLELSQIMLRLLRFQKGRGFDKGHEWATGVDMAQLVEATAIHAQMDAWRRAVKWGFVEGKCLGIGNCDAPVRLTSIQYDSAVAFLYLPYIYVRPGVETAITKEWSDLALQEVQRACSNIARTSEVFVDPANSNDIPLSLGAWILLPIIMKLVFLNTSPMHTTPPSSSTTNPAPGDSSQSRSESQPQLAAVVPTSSTDLHEMRTLMTLLYILKGRYSGGEFVSSVLDIVMRRLNEERGKRGDEALSLLQEAAEVIDRALASRVVVGGSGTTG